MRRIRIPVPSGGHLAPDGLFGSEYESGGTKTYRFFALEVDRGTMPVARSNPNQSSYLGKLSAYREIITHRVHKTNFGLPNFLILTLMTSQLRLTDLMDRLGRRVGEIANFLFKSVDASSLTTPAVQLLIDPLQRAGLSPLGIRA